MCANLQEPRVKDAVNHTAKGDVDVQRSLPCACCAAKGTRSSGSVQEFVRVHSLAAHNDLVTECTQPRKRRAATPSVHAIAKLSAAK
eukprot:3694-Heterococcus_DN1.PRE.2